MNDKSVKLCVLISALSILQSCAIVNKFAGTKYGEAGSIGGLDAPPELVTPEWNESLTILNVTLCDYALYWQCTEDISLVS